MDVYDPSGLGLWRERLAELLRESESYRLTCRLQAAIQMRLWISGEAA